MHISTLAHFYLWIFQSIDMKRLLCLIIFLPLYKGFSQTPKKTQMVTLNGTNIYYEVYGKGQPLFLLHGFTQSSNHGILLLLIMKMNSRFTWLT